MLDVNIRGDNLFFRFCVYYAEYITNKIHYICSCIFPSTYCEGCIYRLSLRKFHFNHYSENCDEILFLIR